MNGIDPVAERALREAGAAARDETLASVSSDTVDDALSSVLDRAGRTDVDEARTERTDPSRRRAIVMLTSAAAMLAVLVAGLVVVLREPDGATVVTDRPDPTAPVTTATDAADPDPADPSPTTIEPAPTTTLLDPVAPEPTATSPPSTEPVTEATQPPPVEPEPPTGPEAAPGIETAIAYECADDLGCTSLGQAPSGALLATVPGRDELVRYTSDGTDPISIPVDGVDLAATETRVLAVGPDDTAYVVTQVGERADLVAIATQGSEAGSVVGTWPEAIDPSGDTDYVPTTFGLVPVGCCGGSATRPDPTELPVATWVDRAGDDIRLDTTATITVGESGNELVVANPDGERRFALPVVAQWMRGMPAVTPLDDGGATAVLWDALTSTSWVLTYGPDDLAELPRLDAGYLHALPRAGSSQLLLVEQGGTLLVETDRTVRRVAVGDVADRGWSGTASIGFDEGVVFADGLNEFIDEQQSSWAAEPVSFAAMMRPTWWPNETTTIEVVEGLERDDSGALVAGTTGRIEITTEGFLDDSVAADRWTVSVEVADDGLLRFVSGEYGQRCQPGRGHQDYRAELCV